VAGREINLSNMDDIARYASLRTGDLDEAREFCRGLYHYPISLRSVGPAADLAFASDVVSIGALTLGRVSYGADVKLTSGDLQDAYHILAPLSGSLHGSYRDAKVAASPSRAAVFGPIGEIELCWPGCSQVLSVKVDRATLEDEVAAAQGRAADSPLPVAGSLDLTGGAGRIWTRLASGLYEELLDPDSPARQPRLAGRWWRLVVSALAMTVGGPGHDSGRRVPPLRPRTVKRTLDAMHADPAFPFTATELARIAGVSTRVLQHAFRVHVGMPPLAYLRQLRLARAHDDLRSDGHRPAKVAEIAHRWGFTHLGRFAGAYRARYGVHPSVTLRHRR
jgi:AraC-like DNA-binding protein